MGTHEGIERPAPPPNTCIVCKEFSKLLGQYWFNREIVLAHPRCAAMHGLVAVDEPERRFKGTPSIWDV